MKRLLFTITLLTASATYCPPKSNQQANPACVYMQNNPSSLALLGYQSYSANCAVGQNPCSVYTPNNQCLPLFVLKQRTLWNVACKLGQLPCTTIKK